MGEQKKLNIAMLGARDIIGSTKKTYDNKRVLTA